MNLLSSKYPLISARLFFAIGLLWPSVSLARWSSGEGQVIIGQIGIALFLVLQVLCILALIKTFKSLDNWWFKLLISIIIYIQYICGSFITMPSVTFFVIEKFKFLLLVPLLVFPSMILLHWRNTSLKSIFILGMIVVSFISILTFGIWHEVKPHFYSASVFLHEIYYDALFKIKTNQSLYSIFLTPFEQDSRKVILWLLCSTMLTLLFASLICISYKFQKALNPQRQS